MGDIGAKGWSVVTSDELEPLLVCELEVVWTKALRFAPRRRPGSYNWRTTRGGWNGTALILTHTDERRQLEHSCTPHLRTNRESCTTTLRCSVE